MLWPKKNSYKEFDNEKKFQRLENSPTHPSPPITFLMVRPLGGGMVEIMVSLWLQACPSSLLPRAWSRALIPFPFPFERLPRRLRRNIKSNKLIHLEPYDYRIYNVNIDLRHQHGISLAESQTSPPGETSLAARS